MVTYLPISSPFIRFAGRYVDEAFGVAAGYNFFVFEAALVPFEIVACNVIIHYWSDVVPAGAIIAIVIVLYGSVTFSLPLPLEFLSVMVPLRGAIEEGRANRKRGAGSSTSSP